MADWRRKAACRDEDPELFFPIGNAGQATQNQVDEARAVCARCPVREACLQWALANGEDAGVWGGWTEAERRQFRRRTSARARNSVRHGAVVDEDRVAALMRGAQTRSSRADKKAAAQRLLASGKTKTEITQLLRIAWSTLQTLLKPNSSKVPQRG
nr:WhiB-like transcription regulator [Kibdelosporangium sp. MJ126-NF4]CTQ96902.1 WhiB-like transcription regulator [Kibdelosporangium sp. MJ126-NF4]